MSLSVTPQIAIKIAAALDTTPDFWLNAQIALDLWKLRAKRPKIRSLIRSKRHLAEAETL